LIKLLNLPHGATNQIKPKNGLSATNANRRKINQGKLSKNADQFVIIHFLIGTFPAEIKTMPTSQIASIGHIN